MAYNDSFVEQLIFIKPTSKTFFTKIALWFIALLLFIGFLILSFIKSSLSFVFIAIGIGAFFGANYLCGQLNVEYEYIFTNGDIDIDRIVNKSKRQRMASFNCSTIDKIEKYNPTLHSQINKAEKRIYHACTPDEKSIAITVRHPKGGVYTVVLSPNESFMEALKKFLPYQIKKSF